MKTALYRFWWARAGRERWALLFAAMVLVLVAGEAFLLAPLEQARHRIAKRTAMLEREVAKMQFEATELPALRKSALTGAGLQPAEVAAHARRFELELSAQAESAAAGPSRILLNGSSLSFDRLLPWLETLQREQGWRVVEMRLAQVANGRVNADITVTRP